MMFNKLCMKSYPNFKTIKVLIFRDENTLYFSLSAFQGFLFPNIPSCGTHPLQPLEVFPEKADGIFWTGDAQLDDALLQDLLDVCKKILIIIIVPAGIGSLRYTAKMCSTVLFWYNMLLLLFGQMLLSYRNKRGVLDLVEQKKITYCFLERYFCGNCYIESGILISK